jgi:hypothetical protein
VGVVVSRNAMRNGCEHTSVEEIRSNGDALMAYQCQLCLEQVQHCKDCKMPLTLRHSQVSIGCTKCRKGKFCNAKTPLCEKCAPAQDGVCENCNGLYRRTGRDLLRKKKYCSKKCSGQAKRLRAKGRLPAATDPVEASHA